MMWARSATLLLASLTVVGCATYEPSPLSRDVVERALQPLDRATLAARAKALRNPLIAAEGFDPEAPVTPGSAAVVAVLSHPTLLAARDRVPVAEAQVLQAGILPNPALTFGLDVPVGSNTNGEVVGYGLGIDWEITALISRGAKVASARAATEQIRLDLSWKEWQVAQAARQAVYDVIALKSKERDAATLLDRLTSVASKADAALAHHDLKATDATAARAAADESRVALAGIRRDLTDAMLTLKQAMGLPADAPIVLDGSVSLPDHLTVDDADRFAANLENRRIDLVALRRGYDSQESTVRAAILSQFPKFSLGLAQNRDTGDFLTVGPSIALEIPVFDHNQSAIAIEKATRQQLLDEYVGRVFEARADVARAIALIRSLNAVIEAEATQVATLCELVSADEAALTHGNLDIATYYAAAVSLSQKQAEFTSLKLDLVHAWISLELAAGARIDPVEQPSTAPVKEDR